MTKELDIVYYISDEDNLPEGLTTAFKEGKTIQVGYCIGWITVDEPDFRCGLEYKVLC